ncbi:MULTISPECIES: hypothetical protein [Halorussus]|uniref:hypothetical protein n=1 Tax=Halorussus TaxID=1070314 RepID=UPI00209FF682|nr:hypothetical protein [Halorussus vallis]USZ75443.1 hypothetical protein NGM07_18665 [Halorussus vallis]
MELTWVAAASVLTVGVGYAFFQRVQQSPLVVWALIGAALVVLSTRDLLRSRDRHRAGMPPRESEEPERNVRRDAGNVRERPTLTARLLRRVGRWLT